MHFLFLSHVLRLLNETRGTEYVVKLLCVDFFIYFELISHSYNNICNVLSNTFSFAILQK